MADGYLIALVRDSTHLRHTEEALEHPSPSSVELQSGAVLSERLTNYLTYDVALPVTPPPLSLPREDKLQPPQPPHYKPDGWWRQSWPDSVTETAARSSEEDEEEDDELFFYQDEQSPPTFDPPSIPSRPVALPGPSLRVSHFSSSSSEDPVAVSPTTYGAEDLRRLANAIYLLSKWFCPSCTSCEPVNRDTVSDDTEARVAKLDWGLLAAPEGGCPLALSSALPIVLAFVARLQRLEHQRHSSSSPAGVTHTPTFGSAFWTLCAALAFQNGLQKKVHQAESDGPRKRACGVGCCRCPGFAFWERPMEQPPRRRIVSSLCSRLLPQIGTQCSPVMQRDCSAALEIIQRFSVAVFIGSAWVEEQEPLSTGVIGGFLGSAFAAFMLDGNCRRLSTTSNAVLAGLASRGTQLRRIAAATATSLYMSIVPCVSSSGVSTGNTSTSAQISCAICRLDTPAAQQHSSPYKSHSTQRALGATHPDFERKLFAVIEFVDCELRILGGELERVADQALKILQQSDDF